jgi:adenine phosphoribosyltransferase|tara:strand:+ start:311 stop:811 length:501 start_codon:yes stop_codon:yes gene_type:complete
MSYKDYITEVPDFPIEGVSFKDISPLLSDGQIFSSVISQMAGLYIVNPPDVWIAVDARGFIFASAIANQWGGGVVMCRKKGKLPPPVISESYDLEYGTSTLEMKEGSGTAVIVDDVLATGGTLQAVNNLTKKAGYEVLGNIVLIDLKYVPRVEDFNIEVGSLISYE